MNYYDIEDLTTSKAWFAPTTVDGNRIGGWGCPVIGNHGYLFLRATLWDGITSAIDLWGPDGVTPEYIGGVTAINSAGDIVGWWNTVGVLPDGTPLGGDYPWWSQVGFVRKADGATSYPAAILGQRESVLNDINDAGIAVGGMGEGVALELTDMRVFACDTTDGSVVDYGKPFGLANAIATGIDNHGNIIGYCGNPVNRAYVNFLLRNGEYTLLPGASFSRITKTGLIIGHLGYLQPAIYDTTQPELGWQQIIGAGYSCFDLNENGVAVGSVGLYGATRAVVWSAADGLQDLTSLASDGWLLKDAVGINAAGQIVGRGDGPAGEATFRATPFPAPNIRLPLTPVHWPLLPKILDDWRGPRWRPGQEPDPSAVSQLDSRTQEVLRGLRLNQLAQELGDDQAQREYQNASLAAVRRVVERLRPGKRHAVNSEKKE